MYYGLWLNIHSLFKRLEFTGYIIEIFWKFYFDLFNLEKYPFQIRLLNCVTFWFLHN